jgi:hypothetical protein
MNYRLTSIAALALVLLAPSAARAAEPEISVACGSAGTTSIRTGSDLRNVRAIHITVDPANKCHVDVEIELKDKTQKSRRAARIHVRKPRFEAARVTLAPRCFNFGGRRYCE